VLRSTTGSQGLTRRIGTSSLETRQATAVPVPRRGEAEGGHRSCNERGRGFGVSPPAGPRAGSLMPFEDSASP
jgi:hypothetical protein